MFALLLYEQGYSQRKNSKFKPCLFPYIHDSLQFGTSFFAKSLNKPFKDHIRGSRLNQTWARQSFK